MRFTKRVKQGVIVIFKFMNIEAERARKGMTKEELSKELGVSTKTYYNWINGERPIPNTALAKMKTMFGTNIDYLLEESEAKKSAV